MYNILWNWTFSKVEDREHYRTTKASILCWGKEWEASINNSLANISPGDIKITVLEFLTLLYIHLIV